MSAIRHAALLARLNAPGAVPARRPTHRVRPRGAGSTRVRGAGEEDDPRLRELTLRAHDLIESLRDRASESGLRLTLTAYVRAAREIGVKGERLHDALELLVHEHARGTGGEPAASDLLRDVLQLADPGFRVGNCPHGSAPAEVPHWCRLYRRAP